MEKKSCKKNKYQKNDNVIKEIRRIKDSVTPDVDIHQNPFNKGNT